MAMIYPLWSPRKQIIALFEPMLHLEFQGNKGTFAAVTSKAMTGSLQGAAEHANSNKIDMNEDVRKLCNQGRLKDALHILNVMDQLRIRADSSTYDSLLQLCLDMKALQEARLVHTHMIGMGFKQDTVLGTKLVIVYTKCESLVDARQVLDEMPIRNVVSWTAMIAAYSRHGYDEEALTLFYQMQQTGIQPNQFTFASVLPACANLAALEHGKEVHKGVIRSGFQSDIFVGNALVHMYAKCGSIEDARHVFDKMPERDVVSWTAVIAGYAQNGHVDMALKLFHKMPERNVVSWNTMIAGYAQNGHYSEALKLFQLMQVTGVKPNSVTFASVLPACANLAALDHGKEVHKDIIRSGFHSDIFVGNALVDMYAKCRSVHDARQMFDKMPERNEVSWATMIAGYAQNGYVDEALKFFQRMPEQNAVSWNTMIAGNAQKGYVGKALEFFQKMPEQNVISWNTMIAGYVQNGHFNEALKFFRQMQLTDAKPNSVTFASVLPACANLAALEYGKEIHENIIRSGFQTDIFVENALVDMYAKSGSVEDAHKVFDEMPDRDVVSWTALIAGYAMHGYGKESLQLFEQMQQSGRKPNHVTFVGVLSACCHAGLVDDGWKYFGRMSQDYHITPSLEHYCCMVDLLGRAGCLDDAQDFIDKMPIKPDAAVWGSLLGACRIQANTELGECVAERLLVLDPENAAHYVLLSNIYAASGRWDGVEKVRKMMKYRRIQKRPGCSWISVNNKMYAFLGGDRSHAQTHEIYAKLERLSGQMKEAGYVPDVNFALHDVEDEQKEHVLYHHSEKLAIAFGLINMPPGTVVRIVKNLRVCGDCHSAIKFISKVVAREIVVRDASRFHHFKDGQCSCGDYW